MTWVACQSRLVPKYRQRTRTVTCAAEEAYLRDDVPCGHAGCGHCRPPPVGGCLAADAPALLMPDADTLRFYLEVFELPDITNWVLLTSVLRQVSRAAGLRLQARLRALYHDRRRCCYLFDDLHCLYTAGPAAQDVDGQMEALVPGLLQGMQANASLALQAQVRQLQQLLVVSSYYEQHLPTPTPIIVLSSLLSPTLCAAANEHVSVEQTVGPAGAAASADAEVEEDVQEMLQLLNISNTNGSRNVPASQTGSVSVAPAQLLPFAAASASPLPWPPLPSVQVVSPEQCFTSGAWSAAVPELVDSLVQSRQAEGAEGPQRYGAGPSSGVYAPHWSSQAVEEGLVSGQLLQGRLHVSSRNPREAVVQVGSGAYVALGRLLRVSGRAAMNRAMDGDTVAVQLLPEESVGSASSALAPVEAPAEEVDAGEGEGAAAATGIDGGEAEVLAAVTSVAAGAGGDGGGGEECEGGSDKGPSALDPHELSVLPRCCVVALLQRQPRDIVACLSTADEAALRSANPEGPTAASTFAAATVCCVPLDRRLPLVRVRVRGAARLLGQRMVLRVDGWERRSMWPSGHVVRLLGSAGELGPESEAVLVQCGVRWQPFCSGAIGELPQVADASEWRVPESERLYRRDLTGPDYFVCSIDPPGCTDVDDALHVRRLHHEPSSRQTGKGSGGRGLVEVGVHIADVSHFVRAGGMLDGEARDRCTTVYLVDRRLDMLPALLSEQLCSLRQGVERLAVSVIWTLREGSWDVVDVWMGRTIIKSRHQLTYAQAQAVHDRRPLPPGEQLPEADILTLRDGLQVLMEVTGKLRAERVANGALELAGSEMRFKLDERGQPVAIEAKAKLPMMDLIAEMMIWANSEVATFVAGAFPGCALLRNHPPPRAEAFEKVRPILEPDGAAASGDSAGEASQAGRPSPVDPSSNVQVAAALAEACRKARDPGAALLIRTLMTQAMSEAKYFSTGSAAPGSSGAYHYGLALPFYTHFTSPIRRYADIVVHRQLLAALQQQQQQHLEESSAGVLQLAPPSPGVWEHSELSAAAAVMNERHRNAKAAQKQCSELYMLDLMHRQPHVESALVVGVQDRGLELFLPKYQIKGRLMLTDGKGLVVMPLESEEQAQQVSDAFSDAERRGLTVRKTSPSHIQIMDCRCSPPKCIWQAQLWQRVWVRLAADGTRAHGPRLGMRLVADCHPLVPEAAAMEAQAQVQVPQGQGQALQPRPQGQGSAGGLMAAPQGMLAGDEAAVQCLPTRSAAVGEVVGSSAPQVRLAPAAAIQPALPASVSGGTTTDLLDEWLRQARLATLEPEPLVGSHVGVVAEAQGQAAVGLAHQHHQALHRHLAAMVASSRARIAQTSCHSKARLQLEQRHQQLEARLAELQQRMAGMALTL